LDVSASMSVPDVDQARTRLDLSKDIADQVISRLNGQNVSLTAFTSSFLPIVPSTNDYLFTRLMLHNLQINADETSGTDIKNALEELQKNDFPVPTSKPKTLVLITDGGDTHAESLQGEAREQYIESMVKFIENAEAQQLQVIIVGVGSTAGKEIPGL